VKQMADTGTESGTPDTSVVTEGGETSVYQEGPIEQTGHDGVLRDGAEAEPEAEGTEAKPKAEGKAKSGAKPWYQQRIDELTAARRAAEAQAAAATDTVKQILLRNANGDLETRPEGQAPKAAPGPTKAQFEAEVLKTAAAMAAQQDFDRQCNTVASQGAEEFDDFTAKVGELQQIYDPSDSASAVKYQTMLSAVLEAGGEDAHKIIYRLAGNLDEATRLMNLPPVRLGVELAKMSQAKGAPAISKAPAPIRPVRGGKVLQNIAPDDVERSDNLSMQEWMSRRNEQISKGGRR